MFALLRFAVAFVDVDNEVRVSGYVNRDLSAASRSIISRSRRLRQIYDLQGNDRSRYLAIIDLNNCFIIRSPSLFLIFKSLSDSSKILALENYSVNSRINKVD